MSKKRKNAPANSQSIFNSNSTINQDTRVVDNGLERCKYVYDLVNGWIGNADNKVNVSCGVFSIVFGVVSFLADHYLKQSDITITKDYWCDIDRLFFIVSLILMAIAVFFYALAITPNLKSSGNKGTPKKYPIYYGDISSLKHDEYRKLMNNGNDKDFQEELISEIYMNSGICFRKMKQYKTGVILSTMAIGFALLSIMCHFIMYM